MSEQEATLDDFADKHAEGKQESESSDLREEGFLTLPYDWNISTVDEVAAENGLVDGDWIESDDMDEDGEIQLVQLAHIGEGRFKGEPDRFITEEFAEEENCTILSEGDLLISRMQEPILRSCLLPSFERDSVMAVDIARLEHTDDWNRHFLKVLFNSRAIWKQGIAWASGTTRKRISRTNMEKLRLPAPPLQEQRKIASVLYTVDQAIQKTEEIIDQIEYIRKGFIQDALTGGFSKQEKTLSRVGPKQVHLPDNWQVKRVSEISDIKNGNRIVKGHEYADGTTEYPFIRIVDMEQGTISTDDIKYLKPETAKQMQRGIISSDDVYITVTGRVGDAGTIPPELDGARFTDNAAKLFNLDVVTAEYLSFYLRSKFGQDEVHRFTVGSTQPKLSMYRVEKMEVIVPPIEEQKKIVNNIESLDDFRDSNMRIKNQLKNLKSGLMQDLLSGEVRTHDKDIELVDDVLQHG